MAKKMDAANPPNIPSEEAGAGFDDGLDAIAPDDAGAGTENPPNIPTEERGAAPEDFDGDDESADDDEDDEPVKPKKTRKAKAAAAKAESSPTGNVAAFLKATGYKADDILAQNADATIFVTSNGGKYQLANGRVQRMTGTSAPNLANEDRAIEEARREAAENA